MELKRKEIENLERKYKLNLINFITGIKPANLIGTRSKNGEDKVAIFSSIVHLGSSPAQIGFVMRPDKEKPRDTFQNIVETDFYTINHVSESFIKKAHYTSAKLEKGDSEFKRMNIEKESIQGFHAPFVKNSAVKIGMKYMESIPLPNGCYLVIGSVELIICPDEVINELGQLDLETYKCVGVSGLNSYYALNKLETFPFVRNNEIPDFKTGSVHNSVSI